MNDYDRALAARRGNRNPWLKLAIDRICAANRAEWRYEFIATVWEFDGDRGRTPVPCGLCGSNAWYRGTLGTYQCPVCRGLYRHDRGWIAGAGRTPEWEFDIPVVSR